MKDSPEKDDLFARINTKAVEVHGIRTGVSFLVGERPISNPLRNRIRSNPDLATIKAISA